MGTHGSRVERGAQLTALATFTRATWSDETEPGAVRRCSASFAGAAPHRCHDPQPRSVAATEVATKQELLEKARKVGADRVIVGAPPLGRREVIRDEPVTTTSSGTRWTSRRDRDGRYRHESYSEQSTTYVPVVVDADLIQYAVLPAGEVIGIRT